MTATIEPMKFDANTFARGWQSCALAASADEARLALCGISVEFFPTGVQLVATDSYMLLRSWVPGVGEEDTAPALDEAPTATVVVLDSYGRADSLMKHLIKLTSGKDALPLEVSVGVGLDPREHADASLPGVEPMYAILDLPGQEILTLRLFEGEYPTWRTLFADFTPQSTTEVSFMPEVIVARLGKLGKLHAECPLCWRFGGAERAAQIELTGSYPEVSGLAMPVRTYLPHFAPETDEQADPVESVPEAVVDLVNEGAMGEGWTAEMTEDGAVVTVDLDAAAEPAAGDDYEQRLRAGIAAPLPRRD